MIATLPLLCADNPHRKLRLICIIIACTAHCVFIYNVARMTILQPPTLRTLKLASLILRNPRLNPKTRFAHFKEPSSASAPFTQGSLWLVQCYIISRLRSKHIAHAAARRWCKRKIGENAQMHNSEVHFRCAKAVFWAYCITSTVKFRYFAQGAMRVFGGLYNEKSEKCIVIHNFYKIYSQIFNRNYRNCTSF